MRKLIATFLIYTLNAYAVPPVSVDSEQSAVGNYVQNTKLPNEQATQLTQRNTRVETGNTNLLKNPSFEHMTLGFGWTISNATYSLNTTNQVEGKKALNLTPTGAMVVSQDSTINAANLAGLQGVASVKIKATGTTNLKVCPRSAGSPVLNLCVNVAADNTWKHVSIPFILGTTSNGIGIATTATGGTVIIDDAFVGTSAPFQDVSGAKLVGTMVVTGCTTNWGTSSTTFVDFPTQTGCVYTAYGQALAPSTNIPAFKFASLPAGDYRIEYEGGLRQGSVNFIGYYQFWDGTNTAKEISTQANQGGTLYTSGISQSISYSTTQTNVTLSLRGKTESGGNAGLFGTNTIPGVFKLWYFPPATKIYSQASQDYAYTNAGTITITTPTGGANNPTKGTIVTDRIMASRKGQNLIAEYQFQQSTAGTAGSGVYLFTLPSGLSFDSSTVTFNTGTDVAPNTALVGYATVKNNSAGNNCNAQAYDATRFRIWCGNLTGSNWISDTWQNMANASYSINVRLNAPIQGWSDYGVIVGSFAGLEKCANDYECTDTFSAQISSAGVVSNENVDWINGNCTNPSTGNYTCTYNTNLKDGVSGLSSTMNCVAMSSFSSVYFFTTANSTTSVSVASTNAPSNTPFYIKCQKGSQDYKPKTAKVASSIGVPTVPGITTQAVDTFSFNYGNTATTTCTATAGQACAYLDQIGTSVLNVIRNSTGNYTVNLAKTYAKLKCIKHNYYGTTGMGGVTLLRCEACNSITFTQTAYSSGAATDNLATIMCQGTY